MRYLQLFSLLVSFMFTQSVSTAASEKISGREIKDQATIFFSSNNIDAAILVSDNRKFFKCSDRLEFYPRVGNDWRTVLVKCPHNPWTVVLRTNATATGRLISEETAEEAQETKWGVILLKNISNGEVIDESHIKVASIQKNRALGSFTTLEDVVGRKVTRNLSRGSILKPRHLELSYDVEKDDTVIVTIGNSKLNVSTKGIALDNGQVGDSIRVRNIKSSTVFRAIISGKKKVTPLANM